MWVQGCDWVGLNGKVETSDGQHPFLLVWVNAGCRRSNDPKEAEAKVYIFSLLFVLRLPSSCTVIIVLHVPGISPAATLVTALAAGLTYKWRRPGHDCNAQRGSKPNPVPATVPSVRCFRLR